MSFSLPISFSLSLTSLSISSLRALLVGMKVAGISPVPCLTCRVGGREGEEERREEERFREQAMDWRCLFAGAAVVEEKEGLELLSGCLFAPPRCASPKVERELPKAASRTCSVKRRIMTPMSG